MDNSFLLEWERTIGAPIWVSALVVLGIGLGVLLYWIFSGKSSNNDDDKESEVILKIAFGQSAAKGRRESMEDEHTTIANLREFDSKLFKHFPPNTVCSFFGVYDGHRGARCAKFVADNLHLNIFNQKNFIGEGKEEIMEAIRKGYLQTDDDFINNVAKKEKKCLDGSTSVTCLILGNDLWIANLGDSEALLVSKINSEVKYEVLTVKHKPSEESENKRIVAAKGLVLGGRVAGLSVSRSFGDIDVKLPHEEDGFSHGVLMSPDPFIRGPIPISKSDDHYFLLMGCDGVWEAMKYKETVDFIDKKLTESGDEITNEILDKICEDLTKEAIRKGSCDNITCLITYFT